MKEPLVINAIIGTARGMYELDPELARLTIAALIKQLNEAKNDEGWNFAREMQTARDEMSERLKASVDSNDFVWRTLKAIKDLNPDDLKERIAELANICDVRAALVDPEAPEKKTIEDRPTPEATPVATTRRHLFVGTDVGCGRCGQGRGTKVHKIRKKDVVCICCGTDSKTVRDSEDGPRCGECWID